MSGITSSNTRPVAFVVWHCPPKYIKTRIAQVVSPAKNVSSPCPITSFPREQLLEPARSQLLIVKATHLPALVQAISSTNLWRLQILISAETLWICATRTSTAFDRH